MGDAEQRMEQADILRRAVARVSAMRDMRSCGQDGFSEEFVKLRRESLRYRTERIYLTTAGENEDNTKKNRYKDILPFEHTRVKLTLPVAEANADYINANFMKGVNNDRAYIATQGPLPGTVQDFWWMVWEYNVQIIVMACREIEMGRKKSEQYWPTNENGPLKCGPFNICLVSEESRTEDYCIRTLKVQHHSETRTIYHFHFITWPDHDVPSSFGPILDMISDMRSKQPDDYPPICFHCSAGCGRTGAICAIDYTWNLLKQQKITDNFRVYKIVEEMRKQRPSAVQTKEQYELVHWAVAELFKRRIREMESRTNTNTLPNNKTNSHGETCSAPEEDDPPPKPPRIRNSAKDDGEAMEEILQPPLPIPVPPVLAPSSSPGFPTFSSVWRKPNDCYHTNGRTGPQGNGLCSGKEESLKKGNRSDKDASSNGKQEATKPVKSNENVVGEMEKFRNGAEESSYCKPLHGSSTLDGEPHEKAVRRGVGGHLHIEVKKVSRQEGPKSFDAMSYSMQQRSTVNRNVYELAQNVLINEMSVDCEDSTVTDKAERLPSRIEQQGPESESLSDETSQNNAPKQHCNEGKTAMGISSYSLEQPCLILQPPLEPEDSSSDHEGTIFFLCGVTTPKNMDVDPFPIADPEDSVMALHPTGSCTDNRQMEICKRDTGRVNEFCTDSIANDVDGQGPMAFGIVALNNDLSRVTPPLELLPRDHSDSSDPNERGTVLSNRTPEVRPCPTQSALHSHCTDDPSHCSKKPANTMIRRDVQTMVHEDGANPEVFLPAD
uniref:protein-tyrosine-phosphatase n=1 Tax=Eptatretus burgeri TaxID=7764 RepID=A0A8C4QXS4_EPTBU